MDFRKENDANYLLNLLIKNELLSQKQAEEYKQQGRKTENKKERI